MLVSSRTFNHRGERNGKNLIWFIKKSGNILKKLKSKNCLESNFPTEDFSTLYTTLPHNLIKDKLTDFIEYTFNRDGSLYLAYNEKHTVLFTSEHHQRYNLWYKSKCV